MRFGLRARETASYHAGMPVLHRQQFVLDTRAQYVLGDNGVAGNGANTTWNFNQWQSDRVNPAPVTLSPVVNSLFQPVSRPTMLAAVMASRFEASQTMSNDHQRAWQYAAPYRGSVETQRFKAIMSQLPFHRWVYAVPSPSMLPPMVPVGR